MSHGIHGGVEARRREEPIAGGWIPVATNVFVDDYRNRIAFAMLAGQPTVIGYKIVSGPRGLPLDVTSVRAEYDLGAESNWDATWVTFAELTAVIEWTKAEADRRGSSGGSATEFLDHYLGVTLQAVHSFMGIYEANGFETRLVFWFTPV
jgi:hypothetical protein